jgi:hypothetical protein
MKNMLKTIMLLGILFILTGAVNNDILYPYFDETAKLYGFKNAAGKIIIKPKYIWVGNRFLKILSVSMKKYTER